VKTRGIEIARNLAANFGKSQMTMKRWGVGELMRRRAARLLDAAIVFDSSNASSLQRPT
jgi:hypothetical protein